MAQPVRIQFWASANFADLNNAIKTTNSQLAALNANALTASASMAGSFAALNKDFARMAASTGMWTSQLVNVETQTQKFAKNLSMGKTSMRDYARELRRMTSATDSSVRKLAAQQVRMQQSILTPPYTTASGKMQAQLLTPQALLMTGGAEDKMARKMLRQQEMAIMNKMLANASTQVINLGKNTQWAGRQLTMGLTFPLTALAGFATKTFIDMEKQLVRLAKVYGDTGGSSAGAIREIQKAVRELAVDLGGRYGIKLEDTISLAADFAARGLTGQELIGATRQTTRLQVLGDLDQEQAMKTTMALQTAFRQNTEQLTESINFLNAVENQTALQLQDVTIALPKVAPVIQSFGGDIKDLTLFLTAMREGAVPAGEAANALKTSIGRLINPTRQAKDTLNGLGIDIEQIVSENAGDLTAMFLNLQGELDKLNDIDKSKALERLFGKMQVGRLTALVENLGRPFSQTSEVIKLTEQDISSLAATANRELLAIENAAGTKLKGKIQELRNTFADFGEQAAPVFIKLLDFAIGFIKAIDRIPAVLKKVLGGGLLFTAIAGPFIMFTGIILNFIGQIFRAFQLVGSFLNRLYGVKTFQLITADAQAATLAQDSLTKSTGTLSQATSRITALMQGYVAELQLLTAAQQRMAGATDMATGSLTRQKSAMFGGAATAGGTAAGGFVGAAGRIKDPIKQARAQQQYRDPVTGRFAKDPSMAPSGTAQTGRMANIGSRISSPQAMGISTVGLLAGMALSTNESTRGIGTTVASVSMLAMIPPILASIGIAAKFLLPLTAAIVGISSALYIMFKRSQNSKQSISDLGKSFANSQSLLDTYAITVNSLSDGLKNNLSNSIVSTRQELEKLNEQLTGDETYDALKNLLKEPSLWGRVKGETRLSDTMLTDILQSEFNVQVALGVAPTDAGKFIQSLIQSSGRTNLVANLRLNHDLTKDQALQNLINLLQGGSLLTPAVQSFIQSGIKPATQAAKQELATYERIASQVVLSLGDFATDLRNKFAAGESTLDDVTSKLDNISIDRSTMTRFNQEIFNSNKELFETDKLLRRLIENTDNLADKMLITYLNTQNINSSLIAMAANFGTIREFSASVANSQGSALDFASKFIKETKGGTKSAEDRKAAIDKQIKALQKQIDALKEVERREKNINKLKELQNKFDERRKNLMADFIDAFTSGDLDAALRAQLNLTQEQKDFRKEYGDTKDEIARENQIKALEDEIKKLQELKDGIKDVSKSSRNNANQVAKDRQVLADVLAKLTTDNINSIKITSESLGKQVNDIIAKNPALSTFSQILSRYKISFAEVIDFVRKGADDLFKIGSGGIARPENLRQAERLETSQAIAAREQAKNVSVSTNRDVNVTGATINVNTKSKPVDLNTRPTVAPETKPRLTQKDYTTTSLTIGSGMPLYQLKTDPKKTITKQEYDKLPAKKFGGFISGPGGPTSDIIPAMLSNGEFVIRASAVKQYGLPMLNAINEQKFGMGGKVPKYAIGGPAVPSYAMGGSVSRYTNGGMVSSTSSPVFHHSPTFVLNGTNLTENDVRDIIIDTQKEFVRKVGKWNK